jgi:hypothetical protein
MAESNPRTILSTNTPFFLFPIAPIAIGDEGSCSSSGDFRLDPERTRRKIEGLGLRAG